MLQLIKVQMTEARCDIQWNNLPVTHLFGPEDSLQFHVTIVAERMISTLLYQMLALFLKKNV